MNENVGFGKANNIGLKYGKDLGYEFFLLLNQDTEVERETINQLIKVARANKEYGILSPVHCRAAHSLEQSFLKYIKSAEIELFNDFLFSGNQLKLVYEIEFIHAAIWFLSRECLHKIGGFDPIFWHYGEDEDYGRRTKYHGFKIGICPNIIAFHYRDYSSKERTINSYLKFFLLFSTNVNKSLLGSVAHCLQYFSYALIKELIGGRFRNISLLTLAFIFKYPKYFRRAIIHKKKSRSGNYAFLE